MRRKSHKAVKIKVPICTGKWRLLDMVTSPPSLSSCIKSFVAEERDHFNKEPPREAWSQPAVCWSLGHTGFSCGARRLGCVLSTPEEAMVCKSMHSTPELGAPPVSWRAFRGGWMVLISWERWQLLHLHRGADQRLARLCRSGLLSIPAAPVTEILLPLGSELWILPFSPQTV